MFKEKQQIEKTKTNVPKLVMNILFTASAIFGVLILITAYIDIWNDSHDFEVFLERMYKTFVLSLFVSFFTAYLLLGYVKFIQKK